MKPEPRDAESALGHHRGHHCGKEPPRPGLGRDEVTPRPYVCHARRPLPRHHLSPW